MGKNSGMEHHPTGNKGKGLATSPQHPTEWTKRAFVIGIVLAVLECLIAPYNDFVIRNTFLAGGHFPLAPFFALTVLALVVNSVLRSLHPKLALLLPRTRRYLVHYDRRCWYPLIGDDADALSAFASYNYFATAENEWKSLFFQYIPEWRVVRDEGAIVSFYEGLSVGERNPLGGRG